MTCGCINSHFSSAVLWQNKGESVNPNLKLIKFNPKKNFSSLDSLKSDCSLVGHQLKITCPLKKNVDFQPKVIRCDYPQNADLPRYYSKKEKKPFPTPVLELRRAARERFKKSKGKPKRPAPPPKNGLVVKRLIPVAYSVFNARITLINNLKKLLKVVSDLITHYLTVHLHFKFMCKEGFHKELGLCIITVKDAPKKLYSSELESFPWHCQNNPTNCRHCNEIHVGAVGHPFKSCRGSNASIRKGLHEWGDTVLEDVMVPIEAYHLYDRLRRRISHEERFSIPRIPAVVELCIQAGVNLPEYPTKRRRKPIIRISKSEFIDADESELPDPDPEAPEPPLFTEIPDAEIIPPSSPEEIAQLAEETLEAWEKMRAGAKRLMKMYSIRVCGYCPEVHVGPGGHKAQNCGAHKHQQRNGQHGWQAAVLNDLIPPRYVWHVPDANLPLQRELKSFYGQAPCIIEICFQAGAAAPEQYKSTMRLDVGIPENVKEAEMVV